MGRSMAWVIMLLDVPPNRQSWSRVTEWVWRWFPLIKLVSIKQSEELESIRAENRLSGEIESKESRPLGDRENILELGAFPLEVGSRPSMGPEREKEKETGTDKQ